MPLNQMSGLPMDLAVYGSGTGPQPFATARDYDRFLARLRQFPRWADGAIAMMREGMARGITLPRPAMPKVVPQLREIVTAKRRGQHLLGADQGDAEGDLRRRSQAHHAPRMPPRSRDEVLPAYTRLADFIERDYLPAARTTVGWADLPDGAGLVSLAHPRRRPPWTMSADEIHELGLREVARIRGEMLAVKEQVGFKGDLDAFFKYLEEDPQFYFTNEDELLGAYRDVKRRIDALLPKLFADFPKADYEIRPVEAFRAASAAGGFVPGAVGRRQAPGHLLHQHVQPEGAAALRHRDAVAARGGARATTSRSRSSRSSPTCRASAASTATSSYSEGWALYAESIGKELGVFTDPYQWYGRLSDEMLRAMRLVVDTGLHSKGWTREQAIKYMLDNSSMAESDVTAEVERYIVWPGQALGYKLGQLRISAVARARRRRSSATRSTCASSTARCCATARCRWTC